jgi:hypothetical protein
MIDECPQGENQQQYIKYFMDRYIVISCISDID